MQGFLSTYPLNVGSRDRPTQEDVGFRWWVPCAFHWPERFCCGCLCGVFDTEELDPGATIPIGDLGLG